MKVAVAVHLYPLESFIYDMVVNYRAFQPIVLSDRYVPDRPGITLPSNIPIYNLSDTKGLRKLIDNMGIGFGYCKYFSDALKELSVDLIHAQFTTVGISMMQLAKKLKLA